MSCDVFICGDRSFPKGNAGGRRMEYIAKTILGTGHMPFICSTGVNQPEDRKDEIYYHFEGIRYYNTYSATSTRWRQLITKVFVASFATIAIAHRIAKVTRRTTILLYSTNVAFSLPILVWFKYIRQMHVVVDVVEWYHPQQFQMGAINPTFASLDFTHRYIYPRASGIIAISKLLFRHFSRITRKPVTIIPAIVDTAAIQFRELDKGNQLRVVYHGKFHIKDDIKSMLLGLELATQGRNRDIEMHMTMATWDDISRLFPQDEDFIKRIKSRIIMHGKLSDSLLANLLGQSHFLFFSRLSHQSTQANFPSKVPEALAYGLPVIANRVGDFPDYLLNNVNSFLFDNSTPHSCAEALVKAHSLPPEMYRQMRLAARACAVKSFDCSNWHEAVKQSLLSPVNQQGKGQLYSLSAATSAAPSRVTIHESP